MKVIYIEDLSNVDVVLPETTATIGFFDGVHKGHQALIKKLVSGGDKSLVITFDYHPYKRPLISLSEKIELLSKFDIDYCVVIMMNEHNQQLKEDCFIKVLKKLNITKFLVGSDVGFGHKAKGDLALLSSEFDVEVFPYLSDKYGKICSSTIRSLIDDLEFDKVNAYLGYEYQITGTVQKGRQIGRTINFPTANILTENYIPKNGIYVTRAVVGGFEYQAVTNIGYQPTVGGDEVIIETHILDFDGDIYGEKISIKFKKRLRCEVKFNSIDELKEQIKLDVINAREYYGD